MVHIHPDVLYTDDCYYYDDVVVDDDDDCCCLRFVELEEPVKTNETISFGPF